MKQILLSKENAIMNKKLLQPDQLPLSAPDHRAARQLREKVLLSENKVKSIKIKIEQVEKTLRDLIMNLRRRSGLRTALNFQGKAVGPEKIPATNGLSLRC